MENLMKTLKILGLDHERLRLDWVSASEGQKFQQLIIEFTEKIKELGPSPFRKTVFPNPIGGGVKND